MKLFATVTFVFLIGNFFAQNQEVKVQSVGVGKDFDKAKKDALRNAIESTIGTYVSSNSSIENNKLISDEVISLTSGLIKSYSVLSEIQLKKEWKVIVEAIVSLDQTINYIQEVSPEGTSVQISGGVYAINEMNKQFAKENELKIVIETLGEMHNLFLKAFNYKLTTDEPTKMGNNIGIQCAVQVFANSNISKAGQLFLNVFKNISLSLDELESYNLGGETYFTITFRHEGELYLFYLRNKKSIEVMQLVFNNFDYYTTGASVIDGVATYPLYKEISSTFLKIKAPDPSGYSQQNNRIYFLHQSSGIDKAYFNQIPIDKSLLILPDTIFKLIDKALEPNEWSGSRKISKKDLQNILNLYCESKLQCKSEANFKFFLEQINRSPSEFDAFKKQNLPKFGFILNVKKERLILMGPKGEQLDLKYFSDEYVSPNYRIVHNLFLPNAQQLVGEINKDLKYSVEQLKKLQTISVKTNIDNLPFKNGGFEFNHPNSGRFIFSLHQDADSYDNLVKNKFKKNEWVLPEEKHYIVIREFKKVEPTFNLFPIELVSSYTSNIIEKEYNFYLTRTLSVYYVGYDGKKKYGGPYIYGTTNTGNKSDKYIIRWIKH